MRDGGSSDRILYIDGLRAVAVLSVVVFHAWQYGGAAGKPLIARLLQMGAHGVDLFFVLSGFCLAYPYLRRLGENGSADFSIAAFAAKRISRIMPPYWIAILVIVSLGALNVLQRPPPSGEVVLQIFLLDRDVHYVAAPFWSLPVEFRWYFLFPLALFAFIRAPRFVLAAAIGSYLLYDFSRANNTPDFGTLPAFLGGIWIADLHLKRSPLQRLALPIFIVYALIAFGVEPDRLHQFYAVEPLGIMATMAFVMAAGIIAPLRALLAHPALRFVGTASYGIYLMHDPILKQLETVDRVAPWIAAIAAVVVSLGFSWICERPFVAGPMREAIVHFLESRFATIGVWMGIGDVVTLSVAPFHPATKIEMLTKPVAAGSS